jgi:hypothetical protein
MKTSSLTPAAYARAVARLLEYFGQVHQLVPE